MLLCQELSERPVVVLALSEPAVDQAYQIHPPTEAELLVAGPEEVVVEHILNALLCQSHPRDDLVVGSQRHLELHRHPRHHSIDALGVHLGEAQSARLQKQVPRMLAVVQVVSIVHNTLDVALIVAHRHSRLKTVFHCHMAAKLQTISESAKQTPRFYFSPKVWPFQSRTPPSPSHFSIRLKIIVFCTRLKIRDDVKTFYCMFAVLLHPIS